ncbi:organoarsenical effux MFS transporter ArsJ [Aliikangiella maris]|uniref:Organoarsenical effux MFS transporter ArsJ n=2 Tax=Aliikangiella maris TaxID=3162458 RepID=A0ABV3MNF5_9GAMM
MSALKSYITVTVAYWAFTLTDGALRMLVVLYFHQLGFDALSIAFLFLFYELFGVVTNLLGGWLAARFGLNKTLFAGLILQVSALYLLSFESYLSVAYVMFAQAISGIAKDLNKMSAKSSLKLLLPQEAEGTLFKWVALLTGSKNTLKGVGFFLGGFLLQWQGYENSLLTLMVGLSTVAIACWLTMPGELNAGRVKVKFKQLFSKSPLVNYLSAARFFLFGARDVWFVIALPVFLQTQLNWQHAQVGTLMAGWIILYGIVQSITPKLLGFQSPTHAPTARNAIIAVAGLLLVLLVMIVANYLSLDITYNIILGLLGFALVFAVNSAIHSYLILSYSAQKNVSLDVGFYYMSNAAGRLAGTLLSGLVFLKAGFVACLWTSAMMIFLCLLITIKLKYAEKVSS